MMDALNKRLEILRSALDKANVHGVVLNQTAYIYHLTNWLPPAWAKVFLVVGAKEIILVTPFEPEVDTPVWNAAIVYNAFSLDEMVDPNANALDALRQALHQSKLIGCLVGAGMNAMPGDFVLLLQKELQWWDASSLMFAVTALKDKTAQQAIRQRVAFLDQAFEVAAKTIEPGVRELQVFGAIYACLAEMLGAPLTLDCNFGSGERSLASEPAPTNKILQSGEIVLIDLFPNLGGYVADYTRNFVVGRPTDGQLAQHAVLEKALSAAQMALRPGILASEIDRLVRGIIEEEGYGEFTHTHHSGHAFGLMIPEPPWIISVDHTPLRSGMVIAVEPGIYHPVNGGMRLEGNFIITENGCESMVGFPATLIACR